VVKAAQIMGKVMKTAVRAKRIPHNPMAEVSLPTIVESEDIYLTPAEVEVLADAMTEVCPRYRALVWLGCYGGPRIGELLALRWTDLDFLRRTVTISRKVIEVTGAGMVEGSTKTKAGQRTVTLPRRGRAGGAPLGVPLPRPGLHLALGRDGPGQQPPAPTVATSGGPGRRRRLHLPRHAHTAVSLWVAAGASDLEVAKWAGHRSASFTKSRYAHLFPEHGEALADRLDAFIAGSTPRPKSSTCTRADVHQLCTSRVGAATPARGTPSELHVCGGRYWFRTSDLCRVKAFEGNSLTCDIEANMPLTCAFALWLVTVDHGCCGSCVSEPCHVQRPPHPPGELDRAKSQRRGGRCPSAQTVLCLSPAPRKNTARILRAVPKRRRTVRA